MAMKKIYYRLSIMLILLMTMSSCSGDDAKSNGDIPIPSEGDVSDEIAAFLKSHYVLDSEYEAFFANTNDNKYYVINSQSDLDKLYTGKAPFPAINFEKYTLIVGLQMMPQSYYTILRQELLPQGDGYTLNLYLPELECAYPAFQHLFFYGVYPKLNTNNITVSVIIETT